MIRFLLSKSIVLLIAEKIIKNISRIIDTDRLANPGIANLLIKINNNKKKN